MCSEVQCNAVRCGAVCVVWCGMVCVVWCSVVWFGVVWDVCGKVWCVCDMVWYGVVCVMWCSIMHYRIVSYVVSYRVLRDCLFCPAGGDNRWRVHGGIGASRKEWSQTRWLDRSYGTSSRWSGQRRLYSTTQAWIQTETQGWNTQRWVKGIKMRLTSFESW